MVLRLNALFFLLFMGLLGCESPEQIITVDDSDGILQNSQAPVTRLVRLSKSESLAARENRLVLMEVNGNHSTNPIPVQISEQREEDSYQILFCMPSGPAGTRKFKLVETGEATFPTALTAKINDNGQVIVSEGEHRVLQYNYQTVYAKDVIRGPDEQEEEHVRSARDTFVSTSIYAVPRSDYIHPLYGPEGEMLTRDWPDGGHPHHRGIFWAWPEVEYGDKKGDIYALQKIFARPSGEIRLTSGPVFGAFEAENFWMWEDQEPLVRERAEIRVFRSSGNSRIIDLTLHFMALQDSITIATRYTDSYGGLNLRMQTPQHQEISFFTDEKDARPQRAWSDFRGLFTGAQSATGLMVFQHHDNPGYPGAWVEYPNLAWVQPTFPTPGKRYALSRETPLVLKYRLVVHKGNKPGIPIFENNWDAYHSTNYGF